jgi:hypothetical protein
MYRHLKPTGYIDLKGRENGAATLAITMILLFSLSLITIYSARVSVVEQRITANEYRARQAFEAAQAGLEQGVANLNDRVIRKQILTDVNDDGLIDEQPLNLTSSILTNDASYAISYRNHEWPNQFRLIELDVTGSSDDGSSSAVLMQAMHIMPLLLVPPQASVTARNNVTSDGTIEVINTETDKSIMAGGTINLSAGSHATTSTEGNSGIEEHSAELQDLAAPDTFFEHFFGMHQATVINQTIHLICNESACNDQDGQQIEPDDFPGENIWITGDATVDSDIGTEDLPVVLIVDGNLVLEEDISIQGLVYITENGHMLYASDTGFINGAMIVANDDFLVSGNLTIHYNEDVLVPPRGGNGPFVAIAGTWRDF